MEKISTNTAAPTATPVTTPPPTAPVTAAPAAALTVYDMCKAVQRDMEIGDIRLCRKSGGKLGDYEKEW